MSTNQTLCPTNDLRGATWRFDENSFSTNMLDKNLSESDVIATLQEMLSSRLGHKRPKAVTGCMIVVCRDQLHQLLHNGNTICIYGFVQCKVATTLATFKRWLTQDETHHHQLFVFVLQSISKNHQANIWLYFSRPLPSSHL